MAWWTKIHLDFPLEEGDEGLLVSYHSSLITFFHHRLPGLLAGYQQGCVSLVRPVCLSFTTVATSATDYTLVWSGKVRSPQDNAN